MSIKSILSVFVASLAFASAYTKPTGDAPKGNPISEPGLASVVPVGMNFTITWEPTTQGTVSLILLKGPATDLKLVYPIVEKIENSGAYVWAPKKDLEPGTTGYGIQLIDDATGQYQYTTQFGISNPDYVPKAAVYSSWAETATGTVWATSAYGHSTGSWSTASSTGAMTSPHNATFTSTTVVRPYGTGASSGYPAGNTTVVAPTVSMTVPSSLKTSATKTATMYSSSAASATSAVPTTGAAANLVAGFGSVAIAAGLAVLAL